jgi:hypothetical protein
MSGSTVTSTIAGFNQNLQTYNQITVGTSAVDVVAIYDQNFNQLFPNVRPVKAKIDRKACFPKHPLETGAVIGDHRILQPIEIEMPMIFSSASFYDDYQAILTAYNSNNSLIIQTKVGTFTDMYIQEMPSDESPETIDTVTLIFKFIQVFVVQSSSMAISKSPTDAATVNKGYQQGTTQTAPSGDANASGGSGSVTYGWFGKWLKSALGE